MMLIIQSPLSINVTQTAGPLTVAENLWGGGGGGGGGGGLMPPTSLPLWGTFDIPTKAMQDSQLSIVPISEDQVRTLRFN